MRKRKGLEKKESAKKEMKGKREENVAQGFFGSRHAFRCVCLAFVFAGASVAYLEVML